jgi:hypothetical protein
MCHRNKLYKERENETEHHCGTDTNVPDNQARLQFRQAMAIILQQCNPVLGLEEQVNPLRLS